MIAPNARKGSESLLVCRSAPLSRKLDTSPLPGRPRKVRRLDEAVGASSSFSLKWVFRGSLILMLLFNNLCPAEFVGYSAPLDAGECIIEHLRDRSDLAVVDLHYEIAVL